MQLCLPSSGKAWGALGPASSSLASWEVLGGRAQERLELQSGSP